MSGTEPIGDDEVVHDDPFKTAELQRDNHETHVSAIGDESAVVPANRENFTNVKLNELNKNINQKHDPEANQSSYFESRIYGSKIADRRRVMSQSVSHRRSTYSFLPTSNLKFEKFVTEILKTDESEKEIKD